MCRQSVSWFTCRPHLHNLSSLTWGNVPGPLPPYRTASDGKLGKGLGTRLAQHLKITISNLVHLPIKIQVPNSNARQRPGCLVVSQATPFAERGRVWSHCNYWVVAEERNYRPLRLGNKMLTSTKHVTQLYSMTMDAIYKERGSDWYWQVSAVVTTRWLQRDQILPLSAKGMACETSCLVPHVPWSFLALDTGGTKLDL